MEFKKPFRYSLLFIAMATPCTIFASHNLKGMVEPQYFNGWSVGAGVGATEFSTDKTSHASEFDGLNLQNVQAPDDPLILTNGLLNSYSDAAPLNFYDGVASLFGRYGLVFNKNFYAGAVLGVNFLDWSNGDNAKLESQNILQVYNQLNVTSGTLLYLEGQVQDSEVTVTRDNVEPFFDLRAGYLLTPSTLAYIKGGINYNKISIKAEENFVSTGATLPNPDGNECDPKTNSCSAQAETNIYHKESSKGIGGRLGAGLEVMICNNVSLAIDYTYTFYPSVNTGNNLDNGKGVAYNQQTSDVNPGGFYANDAAVVSSSKTGTVSDQQVMAQLIYHLG